MKIIKRMLLSLLMVAFMLSSAAPAFAHGVEFVVLGGAEVRFQYAGGQPMSNAEVRVLGESMELIATLRADENGVFDYEEYFGTAARLEAQHNNFTVRFILPEILPRVVHSDNGELVEIIVPAGSGSRLSATSLIFLYIIAATAIGYTAFRTINKKQRRNPPMTGADIASSRRMPRSARD